MLRRVHGDGSDYVGCKVWGWRHVLYDDGCVEGVKNDGILVQGVDSVRKRCLSWMFRV